MNTSTQVVTDPVLASELKYHQAQNKVLEIATLWAENKIGDKPLIDAVQQMRIAETKIIHTVHNCVDCEGGGKCCRS